MPISEAICLVGLLAAVAGGLRRRAGRRPWQDRRLLKAAREACAGTAQLPRPVVAVVLEDPELLQLLARSCIERHAADRTRLWLSHVRKTAEELAGRLGTMPPQQGEAFLRHDITAVNSLSEEEFTEFCRQQLRRYLAGVPFSAPLRESPSCAGFKPVARRGAIEVSVVTLAGNASLIQVDDGATGAELKEEVYRVMGARPQDQRLLFTGLELADCLALHEMGLVTGCIVQLVKVRGPPLAVELQATGTVPGNLCYLSVCARFHRTEAFKDGRPIYAGDNRKFLYYQECRGRWAIADDGDWKGYGDNAWGYCYSTAMHPGELEGVPWHVCDSSYRNYPECRALDMKVAQE